MQYTFFKTIKVSLALAGLVLSGCATFDQTNIEPGQRIQGLGFTFALPTEENWFASVMGNSHRIRLNQINMQDAYIVEVSVNQGPHTGMYKDASEHLKAYQHHLETHEEKAEGYSLDTHEEWVDQDFGQLCVRYRSSASDARGRIHLGPALVSTEGLTCKHETIENVLIKIEMTRRADQGAAPVNLQTYAMELFKSFEYEEI